MKAIKAGFKVYVSETNGWTYIVNDNLALNEDVNDADAFYYCDIAISKGGNVYKNRYGSIK